VISTDTISHNVNKRQNKEKGYKGHKNVDYNLTYNLK
jgi:hypothetical protein